MLRAALSKAMWVGRGAAAVFGLALVLALIMGAATMALAAVPGDPFRLGQTNGIDRLSTLVGEVATPMLRVDNNSDAAGATALDLRVEAGKPPMRVNSATRVANLNADTLDGKSEADFYAAGSKVADSSHADTADSATSAEDADTLDGKDSTEFLGATQKAADSELLDGIDSTEFASAYERTVVVSPVGTDTENGQALLDAITNITDASATKPYLIHIEPATYDLGNGSLSMKPFVDIEGSGELNTVITSGVTHPNCAISRPGTVNGASDAEMRFLTVRNTGASGCKVAIVTDSASPRLTHLTAESTGDGGVQNIGVHTNRSSTTMTDVTATGSGQVSGPNYGVYSFLSTPTIKQSKLTGSGGGPSASSNRALSVQTPPVTPTTTRVALSQLVGGVFAPSANSLQCFNNYNENLAAVACQ
jgi:hypothetical protein